MVRLCKKNALGPIGRICSSILILVAAVSCSTIQGKKEPYLVAMNDETITEKDFVASLSADQRGQYLAFKREHLDRMVLKKLVASEAKRRNQTFEELLQQEVFSKATVSHEEIHAYYEKHKKEYRNKKHAQLEKEIENLLQNQKSALLLRSLVERLRLNSKIYYSLPELAYPNQMAKSGSSNEVSKR